MVQYSVVTGSSTGIKLLLSVLIFYKYYICIINKQCIVYIVLCAMCIEVGKNITYVCTEDQFGTVYCSHALLSYVHINMGPSSVLI